MDSTLQYWVMASPRKMQGVLLLALRGPDSVTKESPAKPIVRTLRALVMETGGDGSRDDKFMQNKEIWYPLPDRWQALCSTFLEDVDAYNIHFYFHLAHAYAVVGARHPDPAVALRCWDFYEGMVEAVHCHPENKHELEVRLMDKHK